jgi:hypothetical protein
MVWLERRNSRPRKRFLLNAKDDTVIAENWSPLQIEGGERDWEMAMDDETRNKCQRRRSHKRTIRCVGRLLLLLLLDSDANKTGNGSRFGAHPSRRATPDTVTGTKFSKVRTGHKIHPVTFHAEHVRLSSTKIHFLDRDHTLVDNIKQTVRCFLSESFPSQHWRLF